jgi:hypothetical protein
VKNVGKDNNEKSKKKKRKKKMGEPRLSGADRSEMRQAEKIKSAGRRKRRKKKLFRLASNSFFLSRVLRVEGIGILVFRSNVSFLFFLYPSSPWIYPRKEEHF